LTNYGFTSGDIPAGSTIDGIEVKIRCRGAVTAGHLIYDGYIYLRKTSGQVGSNKASGTGWPNTFTDKTYGGATDKWGATLSQSDIVSTDFGIDLLAYDLAYTPGNGIPYVDLISIRVYYTAGAAVQKSLGGTLDMSGSVGRKTLVKKIGTLNLSGTIRRNIKIAKAGTLNLSGSLNVHYRRLISLVGSLSFIGGLSILERLLGVGSVTVDSGAGKNTFCLSKFTADHTGVISQVRVLAYTACNVKVGVYSDNGGEPDRLLSAVNDSTAIIVGWNIITIPTISVNQGTSYWIAFNSG
jgi:hypothetical protein